MYNFFLFSTKVDFLKYFQSLSEQKNFRPSGPNFWLFSKIAFYLSIKIFEKNFFLKKTYEILSVSDIEGKIGLFSIFSGCFVNFQFFCDPRDCLGISCRFWRESDFGKNFDIEWNISGLVANLFRLGCQKCILRAHGNVLKRFIFFNWLYVFNDFPHCVKMFCFLPNVRRQSCKNCSLPVHLNFWIIFIYWFSFLIFWHIVKKTFRLFSKPPLARLWKLQSTWSWEKFEAEEIFWTKYFSFSFPENEWAKCFGLLAKSFQRVV